MPTDAENLATTKSNMLATLASITANPKPTYSIDGQTVSWTEYQKFLLESIERINTLLNSEGPYEEISIGIP